MSNTYRWSNSTVNNFRQCRRKYFISSLLSTHGRKLPMRRKAYELKLMQNLKMWTGSVVDKFMEIRVIPLIVKKEKLNFKILANEAVKLAQDQFLFSKNGLYRDPLMKKSDSDSEFCILNIHEIGAPFEDKDIEECISNIRRAIFNLETIKMPSGKLVIDFLFECNQLTANVNNWIVQIEKARVTPQIDLLALSNWKPVIMDWKLSNSYTSDYSRQLFICGVTVYLKRLEGGKPPYNHSDIKLFEVNLLKNLVKEHVFTVEKANELIDYINLSCEDIDCLLNGKKYEVLDIEEFETTDDDSHCLACSFQTLCSYLIENKNQYDEKLYYQSIQDK
jgi:hypothetical protein